LARRGKKKGGLIDIAKKKKEVQKGCKSALEGGKKRGKTHAFLPRERGGRFGTIRKETAKT